jgi:hypothetical protein
VSSSYSTASADENEAIFSGVLEIFFSLFKQMKEEK